MTKKLEEQLSSISTEYVLNQATASLLLLLSSCMEDRQESPLAALYSIPQPLLDLKEQVHRQTAALQMTLGEQEVKEAVLEEAFAMKEKLLSIYRTIHCYYPLWNIISTPLSDEKIRREYAKESENKQDVEYRIFYADCIDFIQEGKNLLDQKNRIGQLMRAVPLKMTRDRYDDLVKASLRLAFVGQSEEAVRHSLQVFEMMNGPLDEPSFGTYFPEVASLLKEKMQVQPAELSDEALDEVYEDMGTIFSALTDMEDYCQELLNAIYSLILLCYLPFSLDELTEKEYGYKDVYFKVKEILEQNEDDTFDETVNEMLEQYIEPLIDHANELNAKEMPLLEKIEDYSTVSEDLGKILATEGFVRQCFYSDIKEEIFTFATDPEDTPALDDWKEAQFEAFCASMRQRFLALPIKMRKAAMALLLSTLPVDWDIPQVMDDIKDAIDTANTEEDRLMIIDKVGAIFNELGFHPDVPEEHHAHADGCTCGEEHHHDDGCTCGHDHHGPGHHH